MVNIPKRKSIFYYILISLRPSQWTKNLFVIAPLIFAGEFTLDRILRSLFAFFVFSLLSGGLYIFNDLIDRERDRNHPKKRMRPIASGALSPAVARLACIFFVLFSLALSLFLGPFFAIVSFSFTCLMIAYTLYLKEIPILDILTVAFSFVLRVEAGASAIDVSASTWIILCTFLLAILLSTGKRRGEILSLKVSASSHREVLRDYTIPFLEQLMSVSASACIISYALYTFFSPTSASHPLLVWTIPFVIYGITRYLYLSHKTELAEFPDQVVVKDLPLLLCIFLWALLCISIILLL
ncbi:decaprenyl-phosphate phosphoribosyltransferase [bacterium]|nr:decaprenyl-phosphate phosphoribosyltransferase [bacterium]